MGFEPTTSSMPSRRAPNCATAPPGRNFFNTIIGRLRASIRSPQAFPHPYPRNELENRGIRQDGNQRGGQSRVVNLRGNQPRMLRNLSEDKREFSDLSESHSHFDGGLPRVSEQPDNARPDDEFSDENYSNEQSQHPPTGEPCPWIDEHANGDKK